MTASEASSAAPSVTRTGLFRLAWPIVLANLAGPLLGIVDTAVIGNLGNPALIGAIAVGAMVFSFLYWGFGFLRMGTTGLVAQASGADDEHEADAACQRALLTGIVIGSLLLLLQSPLLALALALIGGSSSVEIAAAEYFQIRIWGAPIHLAQLAVLGYLLGKQRTRDVFVIQLVLNLTNIALDLLLVLGLGLGVAGVACATVVAEVIALITGVLLMQRGRHGAWQSDVRRLLDREALRRMLVVNRDIMIRTLCLIFAFAWFTNQGAKSGDVILAANAILMQFVSFAAFFLDGYALAAESVVGHATGAGNRRRIRTTIRHAGDLGMMTAVLLGGLFALTFEPVVTLLTNVEAVRDTAALYATWVYAAPLLAVWCYILDGVFIGATRTAEMRNAMIISLTAFLTCWYFSQPLGNHGLWLSLNAYFVCRAVSLAVYLPRIVDKWPR